MGEVGGVDVTELFLKVMGLSPSDRLRMAAELVDSRRPGLGRIAVDIAKSAVVEMEGGCSHVAARLRAVESPRG